MIMSLFYVKEVQRKLQSMSSRCKECYKCFSEERNLRRHEIVHTAKKPYECKQCGKCFRQSRHLRIHERVHSGKSLMNVNSVATVLAHQET